MSNETLAIITPIKNTSKVYFINCINSVIRLSERISVPIEWVIVADGDDRNIEQWVSDTISTRDIQYKVLRSANCIGLGAARNLAVENTNANYLTWLDADDIFKTKEASSFYVEGIKLLATRDDITLVYSDNIETDHTLTVKHVRNKSLFHQIHTQFRNKTIDPIYYVDFVYQAQVMRRSEFNAIGGFNTDGIGEDVELILKLATRYKDKYFYHLPYSAYVYRQNPEGIVSTRYSELRRRNRQVYSRYSIKAGIYDSDNASFEVLYLNEEKNVLGRTSHCGVFFNTFLPEDISHFFYICRD